MDLVKYWEGLLDLDADLSPEDMIEAEYKAWYWNT
jgi:hypothetical protein